MKNIFRKKLYLSVSIFILFFSLVSFSLANGGDQRVVESKYFINLSRAPFTPRVGVQTSFLASFVYIEKNKLIAEDLTVKVRIAKQGGAGGKREFIFEEDSLLVKGGILELKYTFDSPGLHEIFFDFAFTSSPQKVYEVPDFLIDVQKPAESSTQYLWKVMIGTLGGFLLGWFLGKRYSA